MNAINKLMNCVYKTIWKLVIVARCLSEDIHIMWLTQQNFSEHDSDFVGRSHAFWYLC